MAKFEAGDFCRLTSGELASVRKSDSDCCEIWFGKLSHIVLDQEGRFNGVKYAYTLEEWREKTLDDNGGVLRKYTPGCQVLVRCRQRSTGKYFWRMAHLSHVVAERIGDVLQTTFVLTHGSIRYTDGVDIKPYYLNEHLLGTEA